MRHFFVLRFFITLIGLPLLVSSAHAQYIKALSFDLNYSPKQPALTATNREILKEYLDYLKGDELILFSIDPSKYESTPQELRHRVGFLKAFLIDQGIPSKLIQVMRKKEGAISSNTSSESLGCKIIFNTQDRNKRMVEVQTVDSVELMEGVVEIGRRGSFACVEEAILELDQGLELSFNECDYDKLHQVLEFKQMSDVKKEFNIFSLSKANEHVLMGFRFSLPQDKNLLFPVQIKLPLAPCVDKQDLSVYYCQNGLCDIAEVANMNNPEDLFLLFKIQEPGEIFVSELNRLKKYEVVFKLEKGYELQSIEVQSQCYHTDMLVYPKKSKAKCMLYESYYEPLVKIRMKNSSQKTVEITKPLSQFRGDGKIKDFRFHQKADQLKKEVQIPVYKTYFIGSSDLTP